MAGGFLKRLWIVVSLGSVTTLGFHSAQHGVEQALEALARGALPAAAVSVDSTSCAPCTAASLTGTTLPSVSPILSVVPVVAHMPAAFAEADFGFRFHLFQARGPPSVASFAI